MKKYDIIVIGAGVAGLTVAKGAGAKGKKVLLIEKGSFGGDRTNFGCIPSKTLLAAARAHLPAREALSRTRALVEKVREKEEPEALKILGITSLRGTARFLAPHIVQITDAQGKKESVHGKKIVLAAGSSPRVPHIEGLDNTPYLTHETIFSLKEVPKTLAILGGGPVGCELAQAFSLLGTKVHLIHKHDALLPKEEPQAQKVIEETFRASGIALYFNQTLTHVDYTNNHFHLTLAKTKLETEALLIATGRTPNIAPLHLQASNVRHTPRHIHTDCFGRTNKKHIFAIGDIRGGPYYTHLAQAQARAVLTSLLLPFPFLKHLPVQPLPRTTFTSPEIASCGLSSKEAQQLFGAKAIVTYSTPLSELDRAQCDGHTEGFITIVTKKWSGRIVGVTLAAPRAGEMLPTLTLAMQRGISLRKLSTLIFPYPTYSSALGNMMLKPSSESR